MLTCKEASRLASKAMDAKLTWRERAGLSLHLAMCGLCRHYVRDMKKLRTFMRNIGHAKGEFLPQSVKLSEQSRERIKRALNRACEPNE